MQKISIEALARQQLVAAVDAGGRRRGKHRAALDHAPIYPRAIQNPLPVWVAIGGTPASAMRAGALGLPMMMGFFTGTEQFVSRVALYRQAAEQAGHDPASLRLGAGICSSARRHRALVTRSIPITRAICSRWE